MAERDGKARQLGAGRVGVRRLSVMLTAGCATRGVRRGRRERCRRRERCWRRSIGVCFGVVWTGGAA
jgi:hypothetical protein